VASTLDDLAIYVGKAPVVSIPIAVCLFFMMYPIMVARRSGDLRGQGAGGIDTDSGMPFLYDVPDNGKDRFCGGAQGGQEHKASH